MIFFNSILFCILLINSPGKIEPYLDNAGIPITESISEKTFVNTGCIKQEMFIKSKNINNPVLLYVHGGPAFPNYFLIDKFKYDLQNILQFAIGRSVAIIFLTRRK